MNPTPAERKRLMDPHRSHTELATELMTSEASVRRWRRAAGVAVERDLPSKANAEKTETTVNLDEGTATIVGPPSALDTGTIEQLIRDNGLEPAEWVVVSTTLNRWDGPVSGGGVQELRQVKVTLRRRPEFIFPTPAPSNSNFKLSPRINMGIYNDDKSQYTIIEADHQAPYHDVALDTAATWMHEDVQPHVQIFNGDLMDFPSISAHPDHPAAMATVQECINMGHDILRRRAEAAPDAHRKKLPGNHDWRLDAEQLRRAERIYGVAPAHETEAALSLRRLLHLDALGVELTTHLLGWKHCEIEIVPGEHGLVARHGWLTGANTAERSMKKRGRSIVVSHTHTPERTYWWDPSSGVMRQGAVTGCMCMVRGGAPLEARRQTAEALGVPLEYAFPHFAVMDGWSQGPTVVQSWDDGTFVIEHAHWNGKTLRYRDAAYTP